jgi:feruloyl esterase
MAPANPMTELMAQSMWAGIQAHRSPGAALSPAKLGLLHGAVLKQCDALDGLADGIVGRPHACQFDPASLRCSANSGDACLSGEEIGTAQALYGGVRDRAGNVTLPGWAFGSEMQLAALVSSPQPFPVALTYYTMLVNADRANWDYRTFDFFDDTQRGRNYGASMLDVPYTGLGPFFARGGKLLLSHGWNDGLIPAGNTLAFYSGLFPTLNDAQQQEQLRLYMVPGMDHCGGGEGASQFDTLGTIDEWATTGKAPYRIIATRGGPGGPPGAPQLPPITRPLCPYPLYARYDGSGDTDKDPRNFACVAPE